MSWIIDDPDTYENVSTYTPCPCNGKCVGMCMASATFGRRYRSPDEVAAIKEARRRREEDEVLAQADAIRAQRAAEPNP